MGAGIGGMTSLGAMGEEVTASMATATIVPPNMTKGTVLSLARRR